MTIVVINSTIDATRQETEVDTGIVGRRGLPLDVAVEGLRSQRTGYTGHILCITIVYIVVERIVGIVVVTNILLTGLTPTQTELKSRQGLRVLEELLLGDVPSKGS